MAWLFSPRLSINFALFCSIKELLLDLIALVSAKDVMRSGTSGQFVAHNKGHEDKTFDGTPLSCYWCVLRKSSP